MKKEIIICGSAIAVVVLVLASFSPVVGHQTVESTGVGGLPDLVITRVVLWLEYHPNLIYWCLGCDVKNIGDASSNGNVISIDIDGYIARIFRPDNKYGSFHGSVGGVKLAPGEIKRIPISNNPVQHPNRCFLRYECNLDYDGSEINKENNFFNKTYLRLYRNILINFFIPLKLLF